MARRVLLDVDTGTDDAVAIMVAALHPDLELVGVTTVAGNVPLRHVTDNTLRVLDHVGRPDVAVHAGLAAPSVAPPGPVDDGTDGRPSHGLVLDVPEATSVAAGDDAVAFLVDTLRSSDRPTSLVVTGPCTNVAAAFAADPGLPATIDELVVMGGAVAALGPDDDGEFNVWSDVAAAAAVIGSGAPRLTLVTLDATHRALVDEATCVRLDALATPASTAAARFVRRRITAWDGAAAPVHDAVCVLALLDDRVVGTRPASVSVETTDPAAWGRTTVTPAADGPVLVADDADRDLVRALLLSTLGRTTGVSGS